ncbi:hypothetical protein GC163_23520 [bacterium]|nr:hypothetical protein [bacterium]
MLRWYLGLCTVLSLWSIVPSVAAEPVTASFTDAARPKNWTVNFGSWEVHEGVLVAKELEKDQHAAASRWQIPLADGVVKLKVKLNGAKFFHIGFDPAAGQLEKKGHLYSLVLMPEQAQLKKHKDKADATSKDEVLSTAGFAARSDQWLDVELKTEGDHVTATIGGQLGVIAKLEASDPSFHVSKPAVVFRVGGDSVQLDDVSVTVTKAADKPKPKATTASK